MIAKSTIKTIKNITQPLVDVGVVGKDEFHEILQLMISSNQTQKDKKASEDAGVDLSRYLKRREIAKIFNISLRQVDRLMKMNAIRKVRIGRSGIRYLYDDVMTLVQTL